MHSAFKSSIAANAITLAACIVSLRAADLPNKPALSPAGEPTNAAEAAAQQAAKKAEAQKRTEEAYFAKVATLSSGEQEWESALQKNLGSFYLPFHQADKVAGRSNAWDFVHDDPRLPRVLLIGDSVSRGYTLAVRKALEGKANVHRAPANCGPTAAGIQKLDVWMGTGQWDLIHFNFGIHDRSTPIAEYTQRLEELVARMQKRSRKLLWASTTPIPDDPSKKQESASIIERNAAAAKVMEAHGIPSDDLFGAITPHLQDLQLPNDVHFNNAGYEFLGVHVAEAISGALR
jgi:lysophospholipase L1-like esterase